MDDLMALSSKEFLKRLASNAPTPGGGGAAALAAALAVALNSMQANLTIGKEKFAEHETEVQEILVQAEVLREQLLSLVNADADVFNHFMECYRLPKSTEAEQNARNIAVQNAAKRAAEIPLAIAEACLKVLRIAARLVVIGNPGAITDGAVSAILARAALRSAAYNVLVNLKLTKDEVYNELMKEKLEVMYEQAKVLEQQTLLVTDKALA